MADQSKVGVGNTQITLDNILFTSNAVKPLKHLRKSSIQKMCLLPVYTKSICRINKVNNLQSLETHIFSFFVCFSQENSVPFY